MTNEQLDEIAAKVYHDIYGMDAFHKEEVIEFARRLLAEVQKVQEPVTFAVMEGDRILQLSKSQDPFYPHSTPLYKALEITE